MRPKCSVWRWDFGRRRCLEETSVKKLFYYYVICKPPVNMPLLHVRCAYTQPLAPQVAMSAALAVVKIKANHASPMKSQSTLALNDFEVQEVIVLCEHSWAFGHCCSKREIHFWILERGYQSIYLVTITTGSYTKDFWGRQWRRWWWGYHQQWCIRQQSLLEVPVMSSMKMADRWLSLLCLQHSPTNKLKSFWLTKMPCGSKLVANQVCTGSGWACHVVIWSRWVCLPFTCNEWELLACWRCLAGNKQGRRHQHHGVCAVCKAMHLAIASMKITDVQLQ